MVISRVDMHTLYVSFEYVMNFIINLCIIFNINFYLDILIKIKNEGQKRY